MITSVTIVYMKRKDLPTIGPLKTKRLTIPMDEIFHEEVYKEVKEKKRIEVTEWARQLIREELEKIKAG